MIAIQKGGHCFEPLAKKMTPKIATWLNLSLLIASRWPCEAFSVAHAGLHLATVAHAQSTVVRRSTASDILFSSPVDAPSNGVQNDSIDKFAADLTKVLHELRGAEKDPTIPKIFRETPLPSFSNTWTIEDWNRHNSRWRYVDYILHFPNSRMLRRVFPQLFVVVAWSAVAAVLCSKNVGLLGKIMLPLTPLSLVSSFVAVLLTLRSNQGLDRLNQGRKAFGEVVLYTRDTAQLIAAFVFPKDPRLALKLLRHVAIFGWLLKGFLRGDALNGTDEDLIRTMLEPDDADYVLAQRKRPVAVVTRLRQVIGHLAEEGQLSTAEEIALDHTTQELNHCIMTTERIRASPIPPLYTTHAGRLLLFYLFFLPLALRGGGMLDAVGTVITTAAVGFAMLGLDEISHLLEQPFRLMPLYQLSKNSMRDVGDALVLRPPALDGSRAGTVKPPGYW